MCGDGGRCFFGGPATAPNKPASTPVRDFRNFQSRLRDSDRKPTFEHAVMQARSAS